MKAIFANALKLIVRLINILLTIFIVLFLINFITQFIPTAKEYLLIQIVDRWTQPSIDYLNSLIPTRFKGYEFGALVMIILILILKRILRALDDPLSRWVRSLKRKEIGKEAPPAAMRPTQQAETKDKGSLLKQWIDIKDKLEKSSRLLCFLSVDVINSTKMKEEEDPHVVTYTFAEYKKFVEEILNANNVWKVAWTPDGLMSAFLTVDEAVKAGKEIIIGLDAFNKYINRLKAPIGVRCGINYGKVVFDIKTRMEEVTNRVIDIAGHLQKSAEPDTIWIAKEVLNYLSEKEPVGGFKSVQIKVDDQEVVEWKKP